MKQPIRTLVVDDNPVARSAICSVVEGNEALQLVGTANNGLEALEKAESLKPDLILMDLYMPGMDGIETTRRLRRRFPDIRVVMVTVYDTEEFRVAARGSGAHGFIRKSELARELDGQIALLFARGDKNENSE